MSERFISATIVTFNDGETALEAVKSIVANTKRYPLKLYVFDNGSTDNTVDLIKGVKGVRLIENRKNIGFGAAHNLALKEDLGDYHFVINPDITVKSDVLSDMADFMEQSGDIVMAMPKILNTDGSEQKLPKEVPTFKRLFLGRLSKNVRNEYIWANREITEPCEINFCSGCCFGIKTSVFKDLGGFDQRYFMYLEDVDLTLRAKKKGRVCILPQYEVTHKWERTSAKKLKYLLIHISSSMKFLRRRKELL